MATNDSTFSAARAARPDAPGDLDAPWILDPPSRLTFRSDDEPEPRRLLRAAGRRARALLRAATSTQG
jgi:hypothetical protein